MSYWKGLGVAVAIDLVWIMGSSTILVPDPKTVMGPAIDTVTYAEPESHNVDVIIEVSDRLDSLMAHLQERPEDIDAIQKVADIYADNGWWDSAIGPLARALELDPERWSLWSALDRAVEKSGKAMITDAELTVKAQEFVAAIEMWGHGC